MEAEDHIWPKRPFVNGAKSIVIPPACKSAIKNRTRKAGVTKAATKHPVIIPFVPREANSLTSSRDIVIDLYHSLVDIIWAIPA